MQRREENTNIHAAISKTNTYCRTRTNQSAIFSTRDADLYVFMPPKPITRACYRCDQRFHLDDIARLYDDVHGSSARVGVVLVSGKGVRLYRCDGDLSLGLSGLTRVKSFDSHGLPNRHGRGGQSALRLHRICEEKRGVWVKRIAEAIVQCFIDCDTAQPTIQWLILAGPAELKGKVHEQALVQQHFTNRCTVVDTDDFAVVGAERLSGEKQAVLHVLEKCGTVLRSLRSAEVRKATQEVEGLLNGKDSDRHVDRLVFGPMEVAEKLRAGGGGLKTLIVTREAWAQDLTLRDASLSATLYEEEERKQPAHDERKREDDELKQSPDEQSTSMRQVMSTLSDKTEVVYVDGGSDFVKRYGAWVGITWF